MSHEFFKAHIGGDDFFAVVNCSEDNEHLYIEETLYIVNKFTINAREFYSKEDKEREEAHINKQLSLRTT